MNLAFTKINPTSCELYVCIQFPIHVEVDRLVAAAAAAVVAIVVFIKYILTILTMNHLAEYICCIDYGDRGTTKVLSLFKYKNLPLPSILNREKNRIIHVVKLEWLFRCFDLSFLIIDKIEGTKRK